MMDESIGYTFQPQDAEMIRRKMNGAAGGLSPQSSRALQILSLRLPNVMGGRPLAQQQLMTPPVGGSGVVGQGPGGGYHNSIPDVLGGNTGPGNGYIPGPNTPPFQTPTFIPGEEGFDGAPGGGGNAPTSNGFPVKGNLPDRNWIY